MSTIHCGLPGFTYMHNLVELMLFDTVVKIVTARTRRRRLRAAFVGDDARMLQNLEALHDSLTDFTNPAEGIPPSGENWRLTLNISEGPGGSYYPSRPLAQLKPADHDLIVIAASDPAKDSRLADAVHALPGRPDGCVTLRYGAFRNAFLGALYGLQVKKYFTTLNLRKTAAVAASLFFSLAAPGCVIECGTYCGGTAIFLASMMRHLGTPRTVHAFDTFAGLPPAVAEDRGSIFQTGLFANASESFVSDCVKAHGLDGVVQLHKGLVQETIAELWKQENTVCLAFLDTDQYTGTLSSLANVLPRLHPNGLVVVDDCFEPGVQRAVRETLAKVPEFNGAMISYNVHLLWRRTRSEAQSPRS